jgi:hypothetical protein
MILINLENGPKFIFFMASKCGCGTLWELLFKYMPCCKIEIDDYIGQYGCFEFEDKNRPHEDFFLHIGPNQGLPLLAKKINLTKFKKIGFVRKHIDRLLSIYKFDELDNKFNEKYSPRYNPVSGRPSFDEYLIHIKNMNFYNNTYYNLDRYYLNENKELMVDELYNFHNYKSEVTRLFLELGIKINPNEIPHIHETEKKQIEYDASLVEESIIYDKYITKIDNEANSVY